MKRSESLTKKKVRNRQRMSLVSSLDQGHALDRTPGEAGRVLGDVLAGLVEVAVEVGLAEPEGARGDELLHLADALVGPLLQRAQSLPISGMNPATMAASSSTAPANTASTDVRCGQPRPSSQRTSGTSRAAREQGDDHRVPR